MQEMEMRKELLVRDVANYIEKKIAPLKYSLPGDKNGLEFGSLDNEVRGIVTCWSPTLMVIEKAVSLQANLIISHEWLIYKHTGNKWLENEVSTPAKTPNLERSKILSQNNMSILKYHSNWDIAPTGIADSFGEYLGFKNLIEKGKLVRVYKERPITLKALAKSITEKLKISSVKVSVDLNKKVKYIGTAPGGLGQIFTYSDDFAGSSAEVLIFGEMLEYTEIYTNESGYFYIVTSHEASEMPGMLKLTSLLKDRFTQIPLSCLKSNGCEFLGN